MTSNPNTNDQTISELPSVGVLLATYNGSRWLHEQVSSIFRQTGVKVQLYVIDDFSTDNTVADLMEWKNQGFAITVIENAPKKLGVPGIYFYLMGLEYPERFIAFADQDDVWNENHLSASIKVLGSKTLAVSFSPREYMNSLGKPIGISPRLAKSTSTSNAIIENVAYGNTIVMTGDLLRKSSSRIPENPVMHDSWVYLWATVFGETIRHENIGVQYRLHENNHIGVKPYLRWVKALSSMKKFVRQDIEFLQYFGTTNAPGVGIIRDFIDVISSKSLLKRLSYCLSSKCYRQSRLDNFLLKCIIILIPSMLYKDSSNP